MLTPARLTPAEIEERKAQRRSWEHLPKSSADASTDDKPVDAKAMAETIVADSLALLTAEARAKPATMEDLWVYGIGQTLEVSFADAVATRDRIREAREGIERKIAGLEGDNRALRDEFGDLRHELAAVRAARGHSDGKELPASAVPPVQRKPRAPAKPKPNGASPHGVATP